MQIYVYHITVFVLLVLGPALDPLTTKLLKGSKNPNRRIYAYIWGMSLSMACAAVGIAFSPSTWHLSPTGKPFWLWTVLAALISGYLTYTLCKAALKIWRKPELRVKTHAKFSKFDFMLPQTHSERWAFVAVSLVAGFAEEVIFRGFLIRYFAEAIGWPLAAAIPISIVSFGLNHIYQGWKGVMSTTVIGSLFLVISVGFGSLIPAMILHAIIDLRVLMLTLPEGHRLLETTNVEPAV